MIITTIQISWTKHFSGVSQTTAQNWNKPDFLSTFQDITTKQKVILQLSQTFMKNTSVQAQLRNKKMKNACQRAMYFMYAYFSDLNLIRIV